jgi:ubiquinone/menaquinone biosynthesis C-methylase UbiE
MNVSQASPSHFDDIAEHYDASLPAHVSEHYLAKRVSFIEAHCRRGRVLDVGCGTGALASRLSAEGFEVVGVDPSEAMLQVMRRRAPGIEAVRASGTALPFEDASFDLSLSVAAFHHIADPPAVRRTVAEMVRVTRSRGHILIWDHNPRNPYWPILMKRVPQDRGDERLIPADELLDALAAVAARPLLVRQTGLVPDFTPRRLLWLARGLERVIERTPGARRLCAHNVILAESA